MCHALSWPGTIACCVCNIIYNTIDESYFHFHSECVYTFPLSFSFHSLHPLAPPTQHFRRYFVGETEFDRHCNVLICCRVWLVAVPFKNCLDMNVFLKYIWPKWMLCIWNREFGSDPEKCMLKMFASFQTNRFFFLNRNAMCDVRCACSMPSLYKYMVFRVGTVGIRLRLFNVSSSKKSGIRSNQNRIEISCREKKWEEKVRKECHKC